MKLWLLRNRWPLLALAAMVACVWVCNLFCIPAHDELSYAFAGQHTPLAGECPRITTLWDIVRQQWGDYLQGTNGRVFVHGVVAAFAGFRLYWLFDVCNTAMWFLLVWLVLREGGIRVRTVRGLVVGAAVVWWFLWYAETCSMNAAFAVNYLWTAVATVCMMMLWRRMTSWWMVPIAFFYGWSQEAFALPMVAALAGSVVIRSLTERRIAVSAKQALAWGLMVAGAAFLCLGPAAGARAGETLGAGIGGMLVAAAKGWAGLALCVWPAVLAFGVMWVAWRNRRGLWAMVLRAPEWWCYLVAAAGLFSLSCGNGCIRLGMPLALAGVIVALRERRAFGTLGPRMRWGFVAMALAWMLCVTGWQTVLGLNNLRMLRVYRHDPQGVTVFAALPTGPFHYATCHGTYNKFHWMLFRRKSGLAHDPIALTPWLYATLYHAPADFFAMAREVRPGIFVAPRAPRLAVLRGERPPEALCTAAQAWLAASSPQASGWRRFVPGRFRVMFPPEDFQLYIPGNHATITAADGQAYTLVTAPKPKP